MPRPKHRRPSSLMRKRSFIFLTLLAVAAFLASSPQALRRTRDLFARPSSRPSTAVATSKPAGSAHPSAYTASIQGNARHGDGEVADAAGGSRAQEDSQDAMNAVAA